MKVTCKEFVKSGAMWTPTWTNEFEVEELPEAWLQAEGFKKTSYGTWWKRDAYNMAREICVVG